MFDIIDTAFSYERILIVSSFFKISPREKGSNLQLICNVHILPFYLGGGGHKNSGMQAHF